MHPNHILPGHRQRPVPLPETRNNKLLILPGITLLILMCWIAYRILAEAGVFI